MAEKISLASENKFELNKDVVKLLSFVWQGELSPLSTVVGGIAGQVLSIFSSFLQLKAFSHFFSQEVLKGVSGEVYSFGTTHVIGFPRSCPYKRDISFRKSL